VLLRGEPRGQALAGRALDRARAPALRERYATVFPGGTGAGAIAASLRRTCRAAWPPPMGLAEARRSSRIPPSWQAWTQASPSRGRATAPHRRHLPPSAPLTGLHGADSVNLGGPGKCSVEAVAAALGYGPKRDEATPPEG
jgi:hypothetical protein